MTMRLSTGARNFLNKYGSIDRMLQQGRIEIYSGAQPATADAAVTGTLLCTITDNSATRTAEVVATGTVTLNSGAAGSVDAITVNGIAILGTVVPFNTSLTQTAADVAAQINRFSGNVDYMATSSGAVITIIALPGTGASPNGFVVASTVTTLTKTDANMAGGVNAANGLKFDVSTAGIMTKLASQTWSGTNATSGTAGWFRQYGSEADTGAAASTNRELRLDGAIATSGAEMNLTSTAFAVGATTTLASWSMAVPAA